MLTGTLTKFSRLEATVLIEERGGRVKNTVSKRIDFLLVGSDPGSKLDKAKKLAIKIVTEEEFCHLL